jgi:hypothetical protein
MIVTAWSVLPVTYQWLLNNVPISGATNQTLTIPSMSAEHVGQYFVQVSNELGTVNSAKLSMRTDEALTFKRDFHNQAVSLGQTVRLEVSVWGSWPITTRWYHNHEPITALTEATPDYRGARTTLLIHDLQAKDLGDARGSRSSVS